MTFYLKPPRGVINLHNLQECVSHRLSCYESLKNGQCIREDSIKYLIEDSPLDRAGHHFFKIAAFCDNGFRDTFLLNEKKLLKLRLNSLKNYKYLKYFIKKLNCHATDCSEKTEGILAEYLISINKLCLQMLKKRYLLHILEASVDHESCTDYIFRVPFQFCYSLLPNREIIIQDGFAYATCKNWKKMFLSLYHTYLTLTLKEMKNVFNIEILLQDDRISNLINLIQNNFQSYDVTNKSNFNTARIDDESKIFPLCMKNLYDILKQTNRLSHNTRFNFSLYMKSIGVSLSDSLKFWQWHYSKQHASCSKCTHSWEDSEKRYIYGIRHLYGLEGARKNYSVRSCAYFQNTSLTAVEDGGCPFQHFGEENLRNTLNQILPNHFDQIELIIYKRSKNPSDACKFFYESIYRCISDKSVTNKIDFLNPAQYYLLLKQSLR